MTLFDVLCGIGIMVGVELMISLFLLIKYLVCITSPCGWGQEDCIEGFTEHFIEDDKCVCEHPDADCCRAEDVKFVSNYFGNSTKQKSSGKKKKVK